MWKAKIHNIGSVVKCLSSWLMAHEPSDVLQLQFIVLSKYLVRLSIRLFVDAFAGFNDLSCVP